jgi:hypothetical protein
MTGITDTGKNFIAGVVVIGDNCSLVTLIPVKKLSSVLLSPAIIVHRQKIYHRCRCLRRSFFSGVNDTGEKFIADINNTSAPPIKENQ